MGHQPQSWFRRESRVRKHWRTGRQLHSCEQQAAPSRSRYRSGLLAGRRMGHGARGMLNGKNVTWAFTGRRGVRCAERFSGLLPKELCARSPAGEFAAITRVGRIWDGFFTRLRRVYTSVPASRRRLARRVARGRGVVVDDQADLPAGGVAEVIIMPVVAHVGVNPFFRSLDGAEGAHCNIASNPPHGVQSTSCVTAIARSCGIDAPIHLSKHFP